MYVSRYKVRIVTPPVLQRRPAPPRPAMARSIAPMCILVKDHTRVLCEQLQQLRLQTGLVDLDIVCEVNKLHNTAIFSWTSFN